ncbi:hypothetical protein [Nonomuraea sp. NPDC001831]
MLKLNLSATLPTLIPQTTVLVIILIFVVLALTGTPLHLTIDAGQ